MKAPEKIYMTPSFGEPDNVLLASFSKSHLNFHRDIEYTRTDAFIEKACEFLSKETNLPLWEGYNGNFGCDTELLIKNFKNYIEWIIRKG